MFVGIDKHEKDCHATVFDQTGTRCDRYVFPNSQRGWKKFCNRTPAGSHVAFEASSGCGPVYDLLVEHGYKVTVANPYKIGLIRENKQKTDERDSETLAQLLRTGFLPSITVHDRPTRANQFLLRQRMALSQKRAKVQVQIKSFIRNTTIHQDDIDLIDLTTKVTRTILEDLPLLPTEQYVLENLLDELDFFTRKTKELDRKIAELAKEHDLVWLLLSVPGIAAYSAMVFLSEIGDITRFPSAKHLASFIGLVPRQYQSGDKQIMGHITKTGNAALRWIFNQCVIHTVKKASPLRDFYLRVKEKSGMGCARVAAERKLVVILYNMIKNKEEYRFQDEDLTTRKRLRLYGTTAIRDKDNFIMKLDATPRETFFS